MPTPTDVLARVADIIEPHIDGGFKRRERADANAYDLHGAGLLHGGKAWPGTGTVQERVTYTLQCRMSWKDAETVAAELAAAGLLRQES